MKIGNLDVKHPGSYLEKIGNLDVYFIGPNVVIQIRGVVFHDHIESYTRCVKPAMCAFREIFSSLPETITEVHLNHNNFDHFPLRDLIELCSLIPKWVTSVDFSGNGFNDNTYYPGVFDRNYSPLIHALPKSVKHIAFEGNRYEKREVLLQQLRNNYYWDDTFLLKCMVDGAFIASGAALLFLIFSHYNEPPISAIPTILVGAGLAAYGGTKLVSDIARATYGLFSRLSAPNGDQNLAPTYMQLSP